MSAARVQSPIAVCGICPVAEEVSRARASGRRPKASFRESRFHNPPMLSLWGIMVSAKQSPPARYLEDCTEMSSWLPGLVLCQGSQPGRPLRLPRTH